MGDRWIIWKQFVGVTHRSSYTNFSGENDLREWTEIYVDPHITFLCLSPILGRVSWVSDFRCPDVMCYATIEEAVVARNNLRRKERILNGFRYEVDLHPEDRYEVS